MANDNPVGKISDIQSQISESKLDLGELAEEYETVKNAIKDLLKVQKERGRFLQEEALQYARLKEELNKTKKEMDEAKGSIAELDKSLAMANKQFKEGEAAAERLASKIGILDRSFNITRNSMDGFAKKIAQLANPVNLFKNAAVAMFNITIEQTKAMDKAVVDLNKSFGTTYGEKLRDNLARGYDGLRKFGISADDVSKTAIGLSDNISNFGNMLESQQDSLIDNAALLNRFGISAETYGTSYRTLTTVLGESQKEAEKTIRSFVNLGSIIGKQPQKIASEFATMSKSFARYGSDAVGIFFRTEIAAKRLGVETSQLISISEGFDTFEGAGRAVGQLNAILGGPFLNSIQMIQETDPVKRLEAVREAVFASGKDFASMAEYEKKSLANLIPGIGGDVEALGRVMQQMDQGLIETNEDVMKALNGTGDSFEDLQKKAAGTMTIPEMFAAMRAELGLNQGELQGMVKVFRDLLFGLRDFVGYVKVATSVFSSLYGIMKLLGFAGAKIGGASMGAAAGSVAAGAGVGVAAGGLLERYFMPESLGGGQNWYSNLLGGVQGIYSPVESARGLTQYMGRTFLADGGIVTKPTAAMIGEGGQPEVVTPLDQLGNVISTFAKTMPSGLLPAGMNQPPIHIKIELDGRELKSFVKNVTAEQFNPLV